jgi:ketosteroid isomerase-like protein
MKFTQVFAAFVLLSAFFLSSCSQKDSSHEIADKFIAAENAAWATGNLAELEAVEDPAVVYHIPGLELKGYKAHADYITQGRPRVSNLKQSWKYLSGEGTHFALAYESSAILKGDDKTPAISTSNNYLFVFRIANGRVAEVWANGSTTNSPGQTN